MKAATNVFTYLTVGDLKLGRAVIVMESLGIFMMFPSSWVGTVTMTEQTMSKVAQTSGWCCQKQQILLNILLTQQTKNGAIKKTNTSGLEESILAPVSMHPE